MMSFPRPLALWILALHVLLVGDAIASSWAAESDDLFEGCEIKSGEDGQLNLKCPGLFAMANAGTESGEALVEAALSGLRTAFKGPVVQQKTETPLGGVPRPSISVTMFYKAEDEVPTGKGVFVAVPLPDGVTIRVIGCVAITSAPGSELRCAAILQSMAVSLPAPNVIADSSAYGPSGTEVLGRSLSVPQGCSVPKPGRLECEEAVLVWRQGAAEMKATMVLGPIRTMYAKMGKTRESAVKCRIEGVAEQCHVFVIDLGKDGVLHALIGMASRGDQSVFVECDSVRPLTGKLPSPCDQMVSLR